MEKISLKYRTYYQGLPPQQIKLQIPGWAGEPNDHKNGDKPQPWHCIPFVEGSTYGLELLYSFDTECHVKLVDGEVKFIGDFQKEATRIDKSLLPPFMQFAPGHFGMTSLLDIQVPDDHVLRIEPHPKYFTDETYTTPLAITGHINSNMWPKIFFVVFKNPMAGQTYIFRKNEPYAQVVIVPRKVIYEINEMSGNEQQTRSILDEKIDKYCKRYITNDWNDHKGNNFNDKYKILNQIYIRKGKEGLLKFLDDVSKDVQTNYKKIIKKKLFLRKKA